MGNHVAETWESISLLEQGGPSQRSCKPHPRLSSLGQPLLQGWSSSHDCVMCTPVASPHVTNRSNTRGGQRYCGEVRLLPQAYHNLDHLFHPLLFLSLRGRFCPGQLLPPPILPLSHPTRFGPIFSCPALATTCFFFL